MRLPEAVRHGTRNANQFCRVLDKFICNPSGSSTGLENERQAMKYAVG